MKEYKRIKLVQLTRTELKGMEMKGLHGGKKDCCGCGYGIENRDANSSAGYGQSSGDTTGNCWHWESTPSGGWIFNEDHTNC